VTASSILFQEITIAHICLILKDLVLMSSLLISCSQPQRMGGQICPVGEGLQGRCQLWPCQGTAYTVLLLLYQKITFKQNICCFLAENWYQRFWTYWAPGSQGSLTTFHFCYNQSAKYWRFLFKIANTE
jgi:hypothetical protein